MYQQEFISNSGSEHDWSAAPKLNRPPLRSIVARNMLTNPSSAGIFESELWICHSMLTRRAGVDFVRWCILLMCNELRRRWGVPDASQIVQRLLSRFSIRKTQLVRHENLHEFAASHRMIQGGWLSSCRSKLFFAPEYYFDVQESVCREISQLVP